MPSANKKIFIVKLICETTNFHLNMTTCNWSTSTMLLFVSSNLVISLLNHLDYNVICTRLTGQKSICEIYNIIFNPYNA